MFGDPCFRLPYVPSVFPSSVSYCSRPLIFSPHFLFCYIPLFLSWIWGAKSIRGRQRAPSAHPLPQLASWRGWPPQSSTPSQRTMLSKPHLSYLSSGCSTFLYPRATLTSSSTEDWEQAADPQPENQPISPAPEEALLKSKDHYRGKQKTRAESPLPTAVARSVGKDDDQEGAELLLC